MRKQTACYFQYWLNFQMFPLITHALTLGGLWLIFFGQCSWNQCKNQFYLLLKIFNSCEVSKAVNFHIMHHFLICFVAKSEDIFAPKQNVSETMVLSSLKWLPDGGLCRHCCTQIPSWCKYQLQIFAKAVQILLKCKALHQYFHCFGKVLTVLPKYYCSTHNLNEAPFFRPQLLQ